MELKPCPCCKQIAQISYGSEFNGYTALLFVVVLCSSCGLRTSRFYHSYDYGAMEDAENRAVKAWNRRVDDEDRIYGCNMAKTKDRR